jgi:hypothetical protein
MIPLPPAGPPGHVRNFNSCPLLSCAPVRCHMSSRSTLFGVDVSAMIGLLSQPPDVAMGTGPTSGRSARGPAAGTGKGGAKGGSDSPPRPATQPQAEARSRRHPAATPVVRGPVDAEDSLAGDSLRQGRGRSPGLTSYGSFGGGSTTGGSAVLQVEGLEGAPPPQDPVRRRRHKKKDCDRCSKHMLCTCVCDRCSKHMLWTCVWDWGGDQRW